MIKLKTKLVNEEKHLFFRLDKIKYNLKMLVD